MKRGDDEWRIEWCAAHFLTVDRIVEERSVGPVLNFFSNTSARVHRDSDRPLQHQCRSTTAKPVAPTNGPY